MSPRQRNRGLFLNPRYRSLGLRRLSKYVVVELLAPVVEAFGLVELSLERHHHRRRRLEVRNPLLHRGLRLRLGADALTC